MNTRMLALAALATMMPSWASAQRATHAPRYTNIGVGIGHHSPDSMRIGNLNIGLFSATDTLRGFQAGLLTAAARGDISGFNLGGFATSAGGNVYGLQIAGLHNAVARTMNGVQLSGVSNIAHRLNGVQIAPFSNVSTEETRGVQISAVSNIAMGLRQGMQVSVGANISTDNMRGVQLGIYNYADTLSGVQLGIINAAVSHSKGVQVGLVNYSRDTVGRKIGLININPTTQIDAMFFAGNTSKINAALRFRNRSTYSIIGFGTHYMGLDKKFSGALYYRLGQYVNLSDRWSISADFGFSHIETFKENSTDKPERMFSLQAHANVDYRINRTLGAFASIGYGDTRLYSNGHRYENKLIGQLGLTVAYHRKAVNNYVPAVGDSYVENPDDDRFALPGKKRPWIAAAEATGVNVLVFSFNRFVMNEDFAHINFHTIRNNFRRFVWDNDCFTTNLFAHPYHGNLYFNSARSNGLNFWESIPYAAGGSLMWELFGEREPPAINDLMATSMGGTCIGEITNRLSRTILNDRTRGFGRFLREAAALIINPMQGFNRLVRGEAWEVKQKHYLYHDFNRIPVHLDFSVGTRYLADDGGLFRGEYNPYISIGLQYGDPLNDRENKPYDYFTAEIAIGMSANQPLFSKAILTGRLWGAPVYTGKNVEAQFGIFQHFNFYNSEPVKDGTSLTPYRISEAMAFGPGFIYRFNNVGHLGSIEQRIFVDGIVLGGSKSDYYKVIDRDYNMGSGFSFKTNTTMLFPRVGAFMLNASYYRIFTWKGYETKNLTDKNPLYYNVQGDTSNAELIVLNPSFRFNIKGSIAAEFSGSYFLRTTRYKYYDDVHANTFEFRLGLSYRM